MAKDIKYKDFSPIIDLINYNKDAGLYTSEEVLSNIEIIKNPYIIDENEEDEKLHNLSFDELKELLKS